MDTLEPPLSVSSPSPNRMLGSPHHIDLTVSDLDRSVTFYELVLGRLGYIRSTHYEGGAPCWNYQSGSNLVFGIALHAAQRNELHDRYTPGLHHLAFAAPSREDVDDFYTFLITQGIAVLDTPAEYDYTPGYYAVFFADPDSLKLELVYEPKPESSDV